MPVFMTAGRCRQPRQYSDQPRRVDRFAIEAATSKSQDRCSKLRLPRAPEGDHQPLPPAAMPVRIMGRQQHNTHVRLAGLLRVQIDLTPVAT